MAGSVASCTKPWPEAGFLPPEGGYFLMPELYLWHDFRLAGPEAVGTYIKAAMWTHHRSWNKDLRPDCLHRVRCTQATAEQLVKVGLWKPGADRESFTEAVTLRDLRKRRGHRGPIMLIDSDLISNGVVGIAGNAALGAWALAASWSLANNAPGFVPHAAVAELGIEDGLSEKFWKPDCSFGSLWERARGGYRMTLHDGYLERRYWQVSRDDVRTPIPAAVRNRVFARCGYRCVKCGSANDLALDHIYPWSRGGADDEDNLQVLCRAHNSRKRADLPVPPPSPGPHRRRAPKSPAVRPRLPGEAVQLPGAVRAEAYGSELSLDRCLKCGQQWEYALDEDGYELYLDPRAEGGDFAAIDDGNRIACCRPIEPGAPLRPGEYLVSPHICPVSTETVGATSEMEASNAR